MSELNDGFVADGYQRARRANEAAVRAEVESEYAERLANASDDERRGLKAEQERAIRLRLDELAPPDALY